MSTKQTSSRMEDLRRMLKLIKGLTASVPQAHGGAGRADPAVAALGMDPLEAQIRQVYFFDTPDLRLYEQGVVARARRAQKKGDDSVVKPGRSLVPTFPSSTPC